MYSVLWALIFILGIIYLIIRLIWNPHQPPEQQNQVSPFNNAVHNPALINNLQILIVIAVMLFFTIPGIFVTNQGPNGFILGTLPGLISVMLVLPSLFYVFNKSLRKFVWKEFKGYVGISSNSVEVLELGPVNQRY